MFLRSVELGVELDARRATPMIRHRPSGSGHPYSVDTEQRSPVDPVAGEPRDARRAHVGCGRRGVALE